MRYFLLAFALAVALTVGLLGKQGGVSRKPPIEVFPDMDRQPKIRPQTPNGFFADGKASRLPVMGTVARGSKYLDNEINTGRVPGTTNFVATIPAGVTVNTAFMARGKERYAISCLPCHGPLGDGNGVTKKLGMAVVANFHDKRIVQMTDGEIFNTITYGKNLMGSYGQNVEVNDRWAIIAYVRSLQLARLGAVSDLPAPLQAKLAH